LHARRRHQPAHPPLAARSIAQDDLGVLADEPGNGRRRPVDDARDLEAEQRREPLLAGQPGDLVRRVADRDVDVLGLAEESHLRPSAHFVTLSGLPLTAILAFALKLRSPGKRTWLGVSVIDTPPTPSFISWVATISIVPSLSILSFSSDVRSAVAPTVMN